MSHAVAPSGAFPGGRYRPSFYERLQSGQEGMRHERRQNRRPRGNLGHYDDFRNRIRHEANRLASCPELAASSYCYDVLAEAGGSMLSSIRSLVGILRGYSYYD